MSFKTVLAIIITICLTVLIIQNTGEAPFTILFVPVVLPKLVMLTAVSVSAFILGILVSRPARSKPQQPVYDDYDEDEEEDDERPRRRNNTLSDEDRDYIS